MERARDTGSLPSKPTTALALARMRLRLPERRVGVVGGDCGGELLAVTALLDDDETLEGLRVETKEDEVAEGRRLPKDDDSGDVVLEAAELCEGRLTSR